MWEFPGGRIEEGEFGYEALKREIKEELNSVIEVVLYRGTFEYVYPEIDGKLTYRIASEYGGQVPVE